MADAKRRPGEGAGDSAVACPLTPALSPDGGEGALPGAIPVSALTGLGIPELIAALAARVAQSYDDAAPLLTRARHREALEEAAAALRRSVTAGLPELRAEDLRLAWRNLGHITGRADVEDLLDIIFADFCLGK